MKKSLTELCKLITSKFSKQIYKIYLYGSYARGDYTKDSDIDVLIIVDCDARQLREYTDRMLDISDMVSLSNDVNISIQTSDIADWEKFKDISMYYRNVQKEGIRVA